MQTKRLEHKGKKLFYRSAGKGPVVVLLHGFGEDGSIWKGQCDLFPSNQLLIPDLPGSGESEAIDDMSMEGLADAVNAIIESEESRPPAPSRGAATAQRSPQTLHKEGLSNTQPSLVNDSDKKADSLQSEVGALGSPSPGGGRGAAIVLIGHSMGGYVALAFAEKYPARLQGLGLFHSTAYADSEEKKETRRKGIRFIEENGAEEFLKLSTPNLYADAAKEQHPEWIEEHLAATRNFSANNLVSYYRAMINRPDRTAVVKASKVPVLFVMGQHDAAVPLQDGLTQCHLPATAYIEILWQSGHMGMVEEVAEANQILSQFVNDTEKPT